MGAVNRGWNRGELDAGERRLAPAAAEVAAEAWPHIAVCACAGHLGRWLQRPQQLSMTLLIGGEAPD